MYALITQLISVISLGRINFTNFMEGFTFMAVLVYGV